MKSKGRWRNSLGYWAAIGGCLVTGVVAGWTIPAAQFDDYVYDWMLRLHPATERNPEAVVLAIDDATLNAMGGQRNLRGILTEAFELAAGARPRVIASDVILADKGDDTEDARLERALGRVTNLILPAPIDDGTAKWEEPLGRFRKYAAAVAHVEAEGSSDGVTRQISLERVAGHERHWALSLEAFRLSRGSSPILESPDDVRVGGIVIPARLSADYRRLMRVRFLRDALPSVSINRLKDNPRSGDLLRGKVVFLGVTSPSLTRDRVVTPYGEPMSGLEIHAQAFETMRRGVFLHDAPDLAVLGFCAAIGMLAGLIFAIASGWTAYALGGFLLVLVHATPYWLFSQGIVFPYVAPLASVWLTIFIAASYQHFIVRKRLAGAEAEKSRYQQAIHFVTHEMRTPLTAIQGSSELMGRYNFSEIKRKQIAGLINSESKRLAQMIQTFLNVERLSDGQMELKRESIALGAIVEACLQRARPLAERKNITIHAGEFSGTILGDSELMEYAVYNLLTNAIKYSGSETEVTVSAIQTQESVFLSIADQGMGMNAKELKQIFRKFYRTKRAEASGETGTGIGLSIVEQIVTSHGGRMEVTSMLGKGSCFTIVLPLEEAPTPETGTQAAGGRWRPN